MKTDVDEKRQSARKGHAESPFASRAKPQKNQNGRALARSVSGWEGMERGESGWSENIRSGRGYPGMAGSE